MFAALWTAPQRSLWTDRCTTAPTRPLGTPTHSEDARLAFRNDLDTNSHRPGGLLELIHGFGQFWGGVPDLGVASGGSLSRDVPTLDVVYHRSPPVS